jgi:hypothetical protein
MGKQNTKTGNTHYLTTKNTQTDLLVTSPVCCHSQPIKNAQPALLAGQLTLTQYLVTPEPLSVAPLSCPVVTGLV